MVLTLIHFQRMEGDKYLGFFPFEETDNTAVSASRRLATAILNYFDHHGMDINKLIVVGCDGTVLNTGCRVRDICNLFLKFLLSDKSLHLFVVLFMLSLFEFGCMYNTH